MTSVDALVIGAGPAGLAAAAMLKGRGVGVLVIDAAAEIGSSWSRHYDRLHLHTVRWLSGLPGVPIPRSEGKWVSRDGFIRYLQRYARHHRLDIRFRTEARRLERSDRSWTVETTDGPIRARSVIVATGYNRRPKMPEWPGADGFTGDLVHSSAYRTPEPYRGKDVLVVGTGNSGAEIAVDLVEGGAGQVWISVRTPPNIMRRDIKGFPGQVTGVLFRHFPPPVVDVLARGVRRISIGDLRPYGLEPPPRGLYTRVRRDDVIPILDVGLVDLLKKGRVRAVAAVTGFEREEVVLANGERLRPDAVIAATGFSRALEGLVGHLGVLGAHGRPVVTGARTHPKAPGLYFIGFANPISGALREAAIEARRIARAVAARTPSRRAA